jgi:hypothetical protein
VSGSNFANNSTRYEYSQVVNEFALIVLERSIQAIEDNEDLSGKGMTLNTPQLKVNDELTSEVIRQEIF